MQKVAAELGAALGPAWKSSRLRSEFLGERGGAGGKSSAAARDFQSHDVPQALRPVPSRHNQPATCVLKLRSSGAGFFSQIITLMLNLLRSLRRISIPCPLENNSRTKELRLTPVDSCYCHYTFLKVK